MNIEVKIPLRTGKKIANSPEFKTALGDIAAFVLTALLVPVNGGKASFDLLDWQVNVQMERVKRHEIPSD